MHDWEAFVAFATALDLMPLEWKKGNLRGLSFTL